MRRTERPRTVSSASSASSASSPSPRVTAIVLNWCAEEDTTACVRSLLASDHEALTVLVVDNGSPDGSGERLHARFPDVPYLQTGANLGYTGGNNRGIAWALEHGADWVLLVNDDAEVAPDCVRRLVEAAVEGARDGGSPVAGTCPTIVHHHRPDVIWFAGGEFSVRLGMGVHWNEGEPLSALAGMKEPREVTFMTGCVCLLSAAALREVGTFTEDYFAYGEDAELALRLTRAGWRMLHVPRALALHRIADGSPDASPWQIVQRDRNRRRLARRHFTGADRVRFALWVYPTRLLHLARYLARGDMKRARAIVTGIVAR